MRGESESFRLYAVLIDNDREVFADWIRDDPYGYSYLLHEFARAATHVRDVGLTTDQASSVVVGLMHAAGIPVTLDDGRSRGTFSSQNRARSMAVEIGGLHRARAHRSRPVAAVLELHRLSVEQACAATVAYVDACALVAPALSGRFPEEIEMMSPTEIGAAMAPGSDRDLVASGRSGRPSISQIASISQISAVFLEVDRSRPPGSDDRLAHGLLRLAASAAAARQAVRRLLVAIAETVDSASYTVEISAIGGAGSSVKPEPVPERSRPRPSPRPGMGTGRRNFPSGPRHSVAPTPPPRSDGRPPGGLSAARSAPLQRAVPSAPAPAAGPAALSPAVAPPGGVGYDSQIIGFDVVDVDGARPDELVVGRSYRGAFEIGQPSAYSRASGGTVIPADDIPAEGLRTVWIVWSTDVEMLPVSSDGEVSVRVLGDGRKQWTMRFDLTIPPVGQSVSRLVDVVPLTAGQAFIEVEIQVNGEIYRTVRVTLDTGDAVDVNATVRLPLRGSPPDNTMPSRVDDVLMARADDLADDGGPGSRRADLTVAFANTVVHFDSANGASGIETVPFSLDEVLRHLPLVRRRLNGLAEKHHDRIEDIDTGAINLRLGRWSSTTDWSVDAGLLIEWFREFDDKELRELARAGYQLFLSMFPGGQVREALDGLAPGDRIDFRWLEHGTAAWLPQMPWGLMYRHKVAHDGPVDVTGFLGVRHRIAYHAYATPVSSRRPHRSTAIVYWGDKASDPIAEQARLHERDLKRWIGTVLPTEDEPAPRDQVADFLDTAGTEPDPTLIYIYCQTRTDDGEVQLLFTEHEGAGTVIRVAELDGESARLQSLVYLNACESAVGDGRTANEWQTHFFRRGARAYVGTEALVPTAFAARFAAVFFHFLHESSPPRMTAWEALTQARRFFMANFGSIGGLFYSYLNDTEIAVARTAAQPVGTYATHPGV